MWKIFGEFNKICNYKDHQECQNEIIKKEKTKSPMFDYSISIILIIYVFPTSKYRQV